MHRWVEEDGIFTMIQNMNKLQGCILVDIEDCSDMKSLWGWTFVDILFGS